MEFVQALYDIYGEEHTKLCDEVDDVFGSLFVCNNYLLKEKIEIYEKAVDVLTKAIEIHRKHNITTDIADLIFFRAVAFRELGEHEKALLDYIEWVEFDFPPESGINDFNRASAYFQIAELYAILSDYDTAFLCYEKSGDLYFKRNEDNEIDCEHAQKAYNKALSINYKSKSHVDNVRKKIIKVYRGLIEEEQRERGIWRLYNE